MSNEINFSGVYRGANNIGLLAMFTCNPSELIHFAGDQMFTLLETHEK